MSSQLDCASLSLNIMYIYIHSVGVGVDVDVLVCERVSDRVCVCAADSVEKTLENQVLKLV